jgi:hypothetical protein
VAVDGELKVTKMENSSNELAGLGDVSFGESDCFKCTLETLEAKGILVWSRVRGTDRVAVTQVTKSGLVQNLEMEPFLRGSTCDEVVEYVKVFLAWGGTRYTITFKVVFERFDTTEATTIGKLKLCVLAEAGCVGIEESACISEWFEDKFRRRDLCSEFGALFTGVANAELEQRLNSEPTIFRLSTSCLAAA